MGAETVQVLLLKNQSIPKYCYTSRVSTGIHVISTSAIYWLDCQMVLHLLISRMLHKSRVHVSKHIWLNFSLMLHVVLLAQDKLSLK